MFSRVSQCSLVVAVSLAAALLGTGCAASSAEDTGAGAGAQSVPASTLARSYQGTIGTLKVMARLEVKGTAISGSYFYADKTTNGDALVLSGNAIGTKLVLSEAVNGAKTGSFDASIGNGIITGTWKSANGATSLPINLTAVKPGTVLTVTRQFKDSAPAASHGAGPLRTCEVTASFIEVFGLASAAAESTINKKLAPAKIVRDASGKCDSASTATINESVAFNAQGFLTVVTGTEYGGAAGAPVSSDEANFRLADGAQLTAKDFFADNAKDQLKAFILKIINADTSLGADKDEAVQDFELHWDNLTSLEDVQFGVTATGLTVNLTNNYVQADEALAPAVDLTWADLKPMLKANSPILPLVK